MSLRHAILGFLAVQPMSGYDLKRAFDASIRHFWSADQAQIYRTVTALAAEGLLTTELVPQQDRPARKVHHLTPSGRDTLQTWLRAPTDAPPRHEPFLVKLFFSTLLDPEALGPLLDAEIAAAEAEITTLRCIVTDGRTDWRATPGALGPALTVWSGSYLAAAWRAWLLARRGELDRGELDLERVLAGVTGD